MRVEITGADQLRAVSKQLRTVADGKAMRREFTAELRRSTRPAVQSAKEGARSLPSHGRKHTGLRRRMAAAVSAQVRTSGRSAGIKVRMSRARLGDQAAPARLFDRTVWLHPVYGRGRVSQRGVPGWFERRNESQARPVLVGFKQALDRLEQRLARR